MSEGLLAMIAFFGGAVAVMVDGRRAVAVASVAAAMVLAPAAAVVAGGSAPLLPLAAATAAVGAAEAGRWAGRRFPWTAGLDPLVPVSAPAAGLFGPRSVRAAAAGVGLPAASWVGLNVQPGGLITASGAVFAVSYIWVIGAMRLLVARTLEDVACGVAIISLASSAAWLNEVGGRAAPEAAWVAALAPLSALVSGWLLGRHRRAHRGDLR